MNRIKVWFKRQSLKSVAYAVALYGVGALLVKGFIPGLSIWWALVIFVIAIAVNVFIADVEDRSSGGFLNPKPKKDEKK